MINYFTKILIIQKSIPILEYKINGIKIIGKPRFGHYPIHDPFPTKK